MKHPDTSMKYVLCMTCGLCLAISVLTALFVGSFTGRVRSDVRSLTTDKGFIYVKENYATDIRTGRRKRSAAG